MNDKQFEAKVERDIENTKKDVAILGDDGVVGVNRALEQLAEDTKKTLAAALNTFNEGVEQGLTQYNTKIQDLADTVPGDFSKKAAGYPWVTITISLVFGMLLGALLKPNRRPIAG